MIKAGGAITIHLEGDRKNRPSKKCENQSIMSSSPPPLPLSLLPSSMANLPSLTFCFFCFSFSLYTYSSRPHCSLFSLSLSNLYLSVPLSITVPPYFYVCALSILGYHHYSLYPHSADTFSPSAITLTSVSATLPLAFFYQPFSHQKNLLTLWFDLCKEILSSKITPFKLSKVDNALCVKWELH